jgi:hypothetical protein
MQSDVWALARAIRAPNSSFRLCRWEKGLALRLSRLLAPKPRSFVQET